MSTAAFLWLRRGKLSDATLLAIMFDGDMPDVFRDAAEQLMLERGWLDSLIVLVDPPPGDSGIRYMGIPSALPKV